MNTSNSSHDLRVANDALRLFHPAVRQWFCAAFPSATLAQQLSWPTIARGRIYAAAGSYWKRENPRGISLVPQPNHVFSASGKGQALPRAVHLTP